MNHLPATNVPIYETKSEARQLWDRCATRDQPVVAVRDGERGYIVRYDLGHLDGRLSKSALRRIRDLVRSQRPYVDGARSVDPLSETEHIGGETGHVAGEIHAETESEARRLASHVSWFVFDDDNLA